MNEDLLRIKKAANEWHDRAVKRGLNGNVVSQNAWKYVAIETLREVRTMSEPMLKAALETPWPDDMTAQEQIQAMFRAAIDVILKE